MIKLAMQRKKQTAIRVGLWLSIVVLITIIVVIPGLLIKGSSSPSPSDGTSLPANGSVQVSAAAEAAKSLIVPVYLTKEQRIDRIPIESYVRGVVAAEMPVEFEAEALKAQALAARTYIVRRILEKDTSSVPVKGAWVTDTVAHQAYLTDSQLEAQWGAEAYRQNAAKISSAVEETKGLILTYDGKPITATFFSTSNGYTENAEDYWSEAIPYLRSVKSPWDSKLSPRYRETITMPYSEFARKLGIGGSVAASSAVSGSKTLETSDGHRIKQIKIGGKLFSGRQVREKLGLNSSQFQFKLKGKDVEITTTGYGHGVGMSQWGANGMAKEGKTAEQIVTYYYTGIQIESDASYLEQASKSDF
ncbi:stage II sporulation protein D [Paenibacillus sp. MBLB4367]|uniref:stage II sporulation protein D n=1 Tax=Paenibacillus sp. MBLB4367 TaxID=3384767 RepID=UPI0039080051